VASPPQRFAPVVPRRSRAFHAAPAPRQRLTQAGCRVVPRTVVDGLLGTPRCRASLEFFLLQQAPHKLFPAAANPAPRAVNPANGGTNTVAVGHSRNAANGGGFWCEKKYQNSAVSFARFLVLLPVTRIVSVRQPQKRRGTGLTVCSSKAKGQTTVGIAPLPVYAVAHGSDKRTGRGLPCYRSDGLPRASGRSPCSV